MAISIASPHPVVPTAPRRLALVIPPDVPDLKFAMWAPRARRCVFNAWTVPEYVEFWAGARDSTATKATASLCAGALFSITAWRRDVEQYRVNGQYLVIQEPNRIRCTWDTSAAGRNWSSTLQVDFQDFEEGTLLRILQSGIARSDHRERQSLWWHHRLENLRAFLRLTPADTW
jgi:uncharacterized protein YndB with AHSA1/START domain